MEFNEPPILFGEVADFKGREAKSKVIRLLWENRQPGDINQGNANERLYGKGSNFNQTRSEEHTSELQSRQYLVCRLLLEKNNNRGHRSPEPSAGHRRPRTQRMIYATDGVSFYKTDSTYLTLANARTHRGTAVRDGLVRIN